MKNNKKGFTLAELLIVVAIIAILIAIAIPVFSGQLDNAKIQTDHANMRSAYALAQTGSIQGGVYLGPSGADWTPLDADVTYYFQADGSIATTDANAYVLKATASGDKCKESAVCNVDTNDHTKGNKIKIVGTKADTIYKVECKTAP